MIIADIPYLELTSALKGIEGGEQELNYDNRAVAIASAYADGRESAAVAGSFVVIDRCYSESGSFSQAQSSSLP